MSQHFKDMMKQLNDRAMERLNEDEVNFFIRLQTMGLTATERKGVSATDINTMVDATLKQISQDAPEIAPGLHVARLDAETIRALITSCFLVGVGLAIDEEIR